MSFGWLWCWWGGCGCLLVLGVLLGNWEFVNVMGWVEVMYWESGWCIEVGWYVWWCGWLMFGRCRIYCWVWGCIVICWFLYSYMLVLRWMYICVWRCCCDICWNLWLVREMLDWCFGLVGLLCCLLMRNGLLILCLVFMKFFLCWFWIYILLCCMFDWNDVWCFVFLD